MSGFLPHLPLSECVRANQLFIRMSVLLEEIGIVKNFPFEKRRARDISQLDRVLLWCAPLHYRQFGLGGLLAARNWVELLRWTVCDCDRTSKSENPPVLPHIIQRKKSALFCPKCKLRLIQMDNLHPDGCQCPTCCPHHPQDDLTNDLAYILQGQDMLQPQNYPNQNLPNPPEQYYHNLSYPDSSYSNMNYPNYPQFNVTDNQSMQLGGLGSDSYGGYTTISLPANPGTALPYNPQDQPSTSTGITGSEQTEQTGCGGRRSKKTCAHCSKVFVHTGDYRKHMRKHTKEKPYPCNQCGKYFAHTSNLHRHVRSHEGVRPHKCELCGKEFGRKDKLDSHKKCSKSCRDKKPDQK